MIFPPLLGQQAGTHTWSSIIGFLITGVGLPLMGIIAVSKSNGNFTEVAKKFTLFSGFLLLYCFT